MAGFVERELGAPLLDGAVQVRTALPVDGVATTLVGGDGGPVGTTGADGAESGELPDSDVATTVKV
jgi:hypothetical protein